MKPQGVRILESQSREKEYISQNDEGCSHPRNYRSRGSDCRLYISTVTFKNTRRSRATHWSCFETHRLHLLQCLLLKGFRFKHITQKCCSSNFQLSRRLSMISRCWFRLDNLGTKPGSASIEVMKKYVVVLTNIKKTRLVSGYT